MESYPCKIQIWEQEIHEVGVTALWCHNIVLQRFIVALWIREVIGMAVLILTSSGELWTMQGLTTRSIQQHYLGTCKVVSGKPAIFLPPEILMIQDPIKKKRIATALYSLTNLCEFVCKKTKHRDQ